MVIPPKFIKSTWSSYCQSQGTCSPSSHSSARGRSCVHTKAVVPPQRHCRSFTGTLASLPAVRRAWRQRLVYIWFHRSLVEDLALVSLSNVKWFKWTVSLGSVLQGSQFLEYVRKPWAVYRLWSSDGKCTEFVFIWGRLQWHFVTRYCPNKNQFQGCCVYLTWNPCTNCRQLVLQPRW